MADSYAPLSPDDELRRATKAREVLENPVFKDAVRQIEAALIEAIHRSAFTDEKLREKLCQRLASLRDVLDHLKGTMETGKMAEIQLEQKKRFKIF